MLKGKTVQVYVRNRKGLHELKEMRWGLIPTSYAAAPELFDGSTTHARLETVAEKPSFADCWRKKWRCLFPVANIKQTIAAGSDLFGCGKGKRNAVITRADGQPIGIAGIYNAIQTPEGLLLSAAMLTREPGPAMAQIHDREPVVIEPEDFAAWLDGSDQLDLVSPWADDAFDCRVVA
ncbi:MAG: SOS response-associated peptidase family protein [Asticcacaulis sp.]|uniref:SOS response-associated peptidase n=1 Tax=Asticcacaulis sp. TaxID=1872648 RepID=UPI0039E4885E